MKNYLYYPNMEPPTKEWLNFAILYLDKFESIVPYNRRHLVSDQFKQLENESDLVEFFSPTSDQGVNATRDAIVESQWMLNHCYQSGHYFNTININRDWKNPNTWDYQLYFEKYHIEWKLFCEKEGIGRVNKKGIMLPKSLAFLYMTHLAKYIAFEQDLDIITDNLEFDKYVNYSRTRTIVTNNQDQFIRGIIKLQTPRDINEIPLNKLIDFRNKNRDLISAFNIQIDKIEDSIGKGISEQKFIDDYNYTIKGMTEAILRLSKELVLVPLGWYALVQHAQALAPQYIKEVFSSLAAIGGGIYGVRKALQKNQNSRKCKRYLTNLTNLK
ncbi:hypothetical protein [Arachidicoccus terrestris]|uniref:hypothetical protein n=1 Tax=Arachidicoccus terrestris TaxID=2875539 RepID=UPI001CC63F8B|nr:hypothetical protein [Arachidicoccus terrestris]UAY55691.1 hypothetical protein K9M52_01265 [Arachidicoccus terrestris]